MSQSRTLSTFMKPRVVPWEERRPFQQKNQKRDDALLPRHMPTVPEHRNLTLEAWVGSWNASDLEMRRTGIVKLRTDVWSVPLRPDIVHHVVTCQRACRRKARVKTKGRSEVRGGGKKPRPQKGTGKSRISSIRAPHWRGGGRAHPLTPRDWSYKLPRKVVSLGLRVALSDKYRRGALVVLEDVGLQQHKTALLSQKLNALGIRETGQTVMIIGSNDGADPGQRNLHLASRNLEHCHVTFASYATVYDLVRAAILVIGLDGLRDLETRFEKFLGPFERPIYVRCDPALAPSSTSPPVVGMSGAKESDDQRESVVSAGSHT